MPSYRVSSTCICGPQAHYTQSRWLIFTIKPKALNQVFESSHHTFLLVGSLGPHSSDYHCQLLSPRAVFPGGNCWEHQVIEVKELLITERKASLHLLNDSTQRITADTCFSNKNHEYWSYARTMLWAGTWWIRPTGPRPSWSSQSHGPLRLFQEPLVSQDRCPGPGNPAFPLPFTLIAAVFKFPKEGINAGNPTSTDFRLRGHQQ